MKFYTNEQILYIIHNLLLQKKEALDGWPRKSLEEVIKDGIKDRAEIYDLFQKIEKEGTALCSSFVIACVSVEGKERP